MKKKDTCKISLIVYGHEDPRMISDKLGIDATWIGYKGEKDSQGLGILPHNIWSLNSDRVETEELEEHLVSLLDALEPAKEAASKIFTQYRAVFAVNAHYYDRNPQIEFDPSMLQRMADLKVTLWIDMYNGSAG